MYIGSYMRGHSVLKVINELAKTIQNEALSNVAYLVFRDDALIFTGHDCHECMILTWRTTHSHRDLTY